MKNITLQLGIAFAMLFFGVSVYGQTKINNMVKLFSLPPASGGTTSTPGNIIAQSDSAITIASDGVVSIATDYSPLNAAITTGNTTGTVTAPEAKINNTISVRLTAGATVDTNPGVNFGAINSAPGVVGINRASDGAIGITADGNSSGIDVGEGLVFGFDLTNLPSKYSVEISAVSLSTFNAVESCTVVNRQDTSKTASFFGTSAGTLTRDISGLGILIPGGTIDFDAVSFFNNSSTVQAFRITSIEFKIVETAANNVIILTSLTGGTTILPNGTTSTTTNIIATDDSNIAIDNNGLVTIESDFGRTASQTIGGSTFTSGTVNLMDALSKSFALRVSTAALINQTEGTDLGAITTTGGINRASDGALGVTTNGSSSGIDNGEGINFGLNVSGLPANVAVKIVKVYFSTMAEAETCRIVNRQDTSKNLTVIGFTGNSGYRDISSLDILIKGGSAGFQEVVSFYNNSPAAQSFRITGLELEIVDPNLSVKEVAASFSTQFIVSQNPVNETIALDYDATVIQNVSASLIDLNGRIIESKSSKNAIDNKILFEGSSLKSGVYFVKISNETNSVTKKIIKK